MHSRAKVARYWREEDRRANVRTSKRELVDTGGNKMFAKRDAKGQFKEIDDVERALAADRRRAANSGQIGLRRSRRPAASDEEEVGGRPRGAAEHHEQIIGTVCPPRC